MKNLLYIPACLILTIFFCGQLHAQNLIAGVDSYNSINPEDNDEIYSVGSRIFIIATASNNRMDLNGIVSISSDITKYASSKRPMENLGNGKYQNIWDTSGLTESNDYVVSITLSDQSGQLQSTNSLLVINMVSTPPKALSVKSYDRSDTTDSDRIYHPGQTILIDVQAENKATGLDATIQIKSDTVSYDSGIQKLTDQREGLYRYVWSTIGLNPAKDYKAIVTLKDQAGLESQDASLIMEINNTFPQNGRVVINNEDSYTLSSLATLTVSADNATQMYVFGDVVDDISTFEWIPYAETMKVKLNGKDGIKKVSVKFTNKANNESPVVEDTIFLDELPPVITSVYSYDETDTQNNYGIYHSGQMVVIVAETDKSEPTKLEGSIQITSASVKYDSGIQKLSNTGAGIYAYKWNTLGLIESSDYAILINLKDPSNREISDRRLVINIDNTPPSDGEIKINDGEQRTDLRSVTLILNAKGEPREMFLSGDLIEDTNTFKWIPYTNRAIVNLTNVDGNKNASVKFRDIARNESAITTASIILDRKAPTSTSIVIQNGDTYTKTQNVTLTLHAVNAEQMLIDGDIMDDEATFEFVPYKEKASVKLLSGDGEKRVGVIFVNKVGIKSDRIIASIILHTSNPSILSVSSYDSLEPQDNDGVYHSGQKVVISVKTEISGIGLSAKIRIQSKSVSYDSGEQKMDSGLGEFKYSWNTSNLRDANDYVIWIELTDAAGQKTENSDLKIIINNSPPLPGQISINNGEKTTDTSSVKLSISATNIFSIFVSGDLINDNNTFGWIPYQASLIINLAGGDGQKNIYVKFKNAAGNESAPSSTSIILDRKSPFNLGIVISNTQEGAKTGKSDEFTTSQKVYLALSANNATEMFINGDILEDPNAFRWIPYSHLIALSLSKGDGNKIIRIKFRNQRLIESNPIESSIILDTLPPEFTSIKTQDVGDPNDNDEWYHTGQSVQIIIECVDLNDINAEIRIKSETAGYDSGKQQMLIKTHISMDKWRLEYIWNTADLLEGDYSIEFTLTDASGWSKISDPFILHIDNISPINGKAVINKGVKRTASRFVTMETLANDALEMFISGNVKADSYTMQWIPIKSTVPITLTAGDGKKDVFVVFRDNARNETKPVNTSIILSEFAPVIEKVISYNASDSSDNDNQYHTGELVQIAIKVQSRIDAPMIETGLLGSVSIVSSDGKYNTGVKNAREEDGGWYTYVWDTSGRSEGAYSVTAKLSDGLGRDASNISLSIIIDNIPPKNPQININNNAKVTKSRLVNVNLQATDASHIFIDGDVLHEKGLTFEWIPFTANVTLSVRLTDGDGAKLVQTKFKDDANNITEPVPSRITLDTVGPTEISANINNNANYTASVEVNLIVSAIDADTLYIDGDINDGANVRKWIPYQKTPYDLQLTEGDGNKSISVIARDSIGNDSKKISNTIILDTIPPKISSVKSLNQSDEGDNDGRYLEGTQVSIMVESDESKLSSSIQIKSPLSEYINRPQSMNDVGNGIYNFLWDTRLLQASEDYTARIELIDAAGNSTISESLIMAIFDKPIEQRISINNDEKITKLRTVLIALSADNVSEMYISGDVIDDENTFEWIKLAESKNLDLTSEDGIKKIRVEFRDNQSRAVGVKEASIILDQTAPVVDSVKSLKLPLIVDTSQIYRAGDFVNIIIKSKNMETGLKGTMQIRSFSTGYDSGIQKTTEKSVGEYSYEWDTTGIKEGEDYLVEATLSDDAGWTTKNHSLNIIIDNTPPKGGSYIINNGEKVTRKRSVKLAITPGDESKEMFVDGDVMRDSNTFQWIPINNELIVNLVLGDAEKKISVKFRDRSGNETIPIKNSIILDEIPPTINTVISYDEENTIDSDGIYHAGQAVRILMTVAEEPSSTTLEAWMRVTSQKNGYDSGLLAATQESKLLFNAVWKTLSVQESSDYVVEVILQDNYGQKINKDSLVITIDNTLPVISDMSINKGENSTSLQDITLNVTAKDVKDIVEMLINGDVVESAVTFNWIPYTEIRRIRLSAGNGTKNITVKLRDKAGNISEPSSTKIILNKSLPTSLSININDGAKYTESYQIKLLLSADNAKEMYISGDIVQSENTFKWVPYQRDFDSRLTSKEGEKTVYARFRNDAGSESDDVKAQILLDLTSPKIISIESFDNADQTDKDFVYNSGQKIMIRTTASGSETGLKGWVRIQTNDAKYDTGRQNMIDLGRGQYIFLWDTASIEEGNYTCEITLEDPANHLVSDKVEILIDNQSPQNPAIAIGGKDSFAYARTVEIILSAEGSPTEVFIAGDIIDDSKTFEWIPFMPDENGKMKVNLNLRGIDGNKELTAIFRGKSKSESSKAETSMVLELKRPELISSCRLVQTDKEPFRAFLTLQFDEPISRIDAKNFLLTLRDKINPQNTIQLDAASTEPVLANDIITLEVPEEQFDRIKQWQPMTLVTSYIQAIITENSAFDLSDKGNLSNEQKPADVYIITPDLSMQISVNTVSFSPNGDGIKDKIIISYSLFRVSDVTIRIRDSQMITIKEWNIENQFGGLVYPVEWGGEKPDGLIYPDGSYSVIIMSKVLEANGFAYGLKQNFTIDNTPPNILDVRPGEGARVPALFRSSISVLDMPEISGIESAYATIDGDIVNRIPLAKSKTKGEYIIPATSTLLLPLGKHSVSFHAVDMAGNETEKIVNYIVVDSVKTALSLINFPNPFSPGNTTTIRYSLPEKAISGELVIYDSSGDLVFFKELASAELEANEHILQWDGKGLFGNILGRGIYFCQLRVTTETGNESRRQKIAIR